MAPRRILIVGNYPADQQQSMIRFAKVLVRFYEPFAEVHLISPPPLVSSLPGLPPFARKYLAYIDKLLLFSTWLALRARSYQLIHIADHSNSFYSFFGPRSRCIVTCHDLLAVRGAFGDANVACEPSAIGIWLQHLIMAGLRHAGAVVFDSQTSFDDFQRLVGAPLPQRYAVIPIPLNAPFTANTGTLQLSEKEQQLIPSVPYLLMVGSALPRKNRILALRLLLELGAASPYRLVFAGAPPSPAEHSFITEHHLSSRFHSVVRPSHALLNNLYCRAHALLFPSLAEGFGWPIVEAQACDCPVIASTTTSIPEVAGPAALYADPHDVITFAHHVQALESPTLRTRLVSQGHENLRRYEFNVISRAYIRFALQPAQRSM
jgi:glycosyltransferase involved in cell wall biosynthesis